MYRSRSPFSQYRITLKIQEMKITANFHYGLALFGFFGLFLLLMLWNTVLATSSKLPTAIILIITVTPLLLPMRGFLHGQLRSSAWVAYISLLYFVHGCVEAYANNTARTYALLEIVFSLMIFFGAGFYIRLSKRH